MTNPPEVLAWTESRRADVLQRAAQTWRRGGLVVIPTDTVYGLAADPRNAAAVEKLWAAKGRGLEKKIALLAADLTAVRRAASRFDAIAQRLAERFWPGPLTLVLPTAEGAEGFRIPDDPAALALLRAAGGLLRVTSANRSGEAPARTAAEALQSLGDAVDLIIDAGPARGGVPSTVVVIEEDGLKITREGALGTAEIQAATGLIHHE